MKNKFTSQQNHCFMNCTFQVFLVVLTLAFISLWHFLSLWSFWSFCSLLFLWSSSLELHRQTTIWVLKTIIDWAAYGVSDEEFMLKSEGRITNQKLGIGNNQSGSCDKIPIEKIASPTPKPKHKSQWHFIHWRFVHGIHFTMSYRVNKIKWK